MNRILKTNGRLRAPRKNKKWLLITMYLAIIY
jgi:hypothetical protein